MDLDYAARFVTYDPESGIFTWLPRDPSLYNRLQSAARFNNAYAGTRADSRSGREGYLRVSIRLNGHNQYTPAHRLAWYMYHGEIPDQIDHVNGDRSDNRISNLRSVSQKENCKNLGLDSRNTSGKSGVSFCKWEGKWRAKGSVNGKWKHLGSFITKQEAIDARSKFESEMGYHPNHGARPGWVFSTGISVL